MAAASIISSEEGYQDQGFPGIDALQVEKRYNEERAKRLRDEGNSQFIEPSLSEKFHSFIEDPWADSATIRDIKTMFPDNSCQMLILGAGWGGLLHAIRMIQAGFPARDLRIVDTAGGFGGTWYWNRYPGISCDIESYSYLPLLEETGYMPRHRYAYGEEIRDYANFAAKKWGLEAVFQTKAEKLEWDEEEKEWHADLVQHRKGEEPQNLSIRAQFVATVNGALNWPKLPGIPGLLDYKGAVFHSSRWNYEVTGGSPTNPSLSKLCDKRVAIVGTGATAVQIVPHLARWAKHLYVVQRTPASVDEQHQYETDKEWFKKHAATGSGWQRERMRNLHEHLTTGKKPDVNMVADGWTTAPTMCAISGNEEGPRTPDDLPDYMKKLFALDLPRQNRIRRRVEEVVHDPSVARKLQAWYPTWCKRPCFHGEYLSSFNRENVTLVDTDGQGPDNITIDSIVAGGISYPVDLIIFATGFRAPFAGSPASKANMTIRGRNGISMSDQWARAGPSTLHGVLDSNFPNLFLSGPWQAALSPNNLFNTDALALRSAPMAAIIGCTPSYFNVEGELDRVPPEMQSMVSKSGLWGHGIESFVKVLEKWREEGNMEGVEVRT